MGRFKENYRGTPEKRFWSKVNKDGPTMRDMTTPCWEWVGSKTDDNRRFPQINIDGKIIKGARFSYQLSYGDIPDKAKLFHYCSNKKCVRPDHLFVSFDGVHAPKRFPVITIDGIDYKRCSTCDELFPYDTDHYHATGTGTLRSYCKNCSYKANRKRRANYWAYGLWVHAKDGAKAKGIEFTLTLEDVQDIYNKQNGLCYWFNVPMIPSDKPRFPQQPSLDRLNLFGGYTKDNVVLCCFVANMGRSHNTTEEFSSFVEVLKRSLCQNCE